MPVGDDRFDDMARRVQVALARQAPALIVLCAADGTVARARARLHTLDRALSETADRLTTARVSRSATEGLAAWAISTVGPIGVDVQAAPATLDDAVIEAALQPQEVLWIDAQPDRGCAFAQLWAAKEAVLKAFGVGLAWSPRAVPALPVSAAWRAVHVPALGHAWLCSPAAPGAPSPMALAVAINVGHSPPV